MRNILGKIIIICTMVIGVCGCSKDEVSNATQAVENEQTSEMTAETSQEETTEEIVLNNTDTMQMLIENNKEISQYSNLTECEILSDLSLVVPKDGEESKSDNLISVEKDGVVVEIILNPNVRQGMTDYPVYESLREYIENNYKKKVNPDYKDISKGGIEDVSMDSARSVVSYIDTARNEENICDATWYMIDLNEENSLLLNVVIHYADITDNTENIIDEMERYYDIKIQYDKDAAKKKSAEIIEASTPKLQTFTYGAMLFELPENWDIDNDFQYSNMKCYAINGSSNKNGCGISVAQYYNSNNSDKSVYFEKEEYIEQMIKEGTNGACSDINIQDAGQTFLGDTVKVTYKITVQGYSMHYVAYYGMTTNYVNMIAAYGVGNKVNTATDALEIIFETGRCN